MTPVVAIVPFSGRSRRTNQCEVSDHTQLSPAGSSEDTGRKGEHGGGERARNLRPVSPGVGAFAASEGWKAGAWQGLALTMGRISCRNTGWGLQEVRPGLLGLYAPRLLLGSNLRAQAFLLLEASLPSTFPVAPPQAHPVSPFPTPNLYALNTASVLFGSILHPQSHSWLHHSISASAFTSPSPLSTPLL